ncbi:hypothetical protein A7Q01_09030 [Eikenella sp. NML96-A-049]|nr:hypothetical protein A7P94_08600 [Eikenella sp. NML01-A-086]OAM34779.1 hypothetical protein A7P97_06375 [Eikenella sp. NML070372]OAM39520.1 hypothetical protein A7Q01_09030 [Eikenella sp. NML96-A-049]OAM40859.1 hypothetical protein A7Q02_05765 [Eikenella sp. NML97-A-109]
MPRFHLCHLMRIKAGMVFLPQANQLAQAGHIEVHIQPLPVALRAPDGFSASASIISCPARIQSPA